MKLTPDELLDIARKAAGAAVRAMGGDFDELFSEAYIAAAEAAENVRNGDTGEPVRTPRAYVATAAINRLRDIRRRDGARGRLIINATDLGLDGEGDGLPLDDFPAAEPGPDVEPDERDGIAEAFAELTEGALDAVRLRFDEGLAFDEVGRRLGLSEPGARKRVGTAVRRLRRGSRPAS